MSPRRPAEANTFGRLLRLWRNASGLSQEGLAHAIGVSTRHLSFLETGKAAANLNLVIALGSHFRLGERERGNLIQAAGLLPSSATGPAATENLSAQRRSLALTLRAFDPYPAAIIDPCANVKLVNRAWVLENRRLYGEPAMAVDVNTIRLLVNAHGRTQDDALLDLICLYLLILQQEVIIRDSREAATLVAELTHAGGVPDDWLQRGASMAMRAQGHDHREIRRDVHGRERVFWNIHHTVGSTPYVSEPRLLIHVVVPEDGAPDVTNAMLGGEGLEHPLLATSLDLS